MQQEEVVREGEEMEVREGEEMEVREDGAEGAGGGVSVLDWLAAVSVGREEGVFVPSDENST